MLWGNLFMYVDTYLPFPIVDFKSQYILTQIVSPVEGLAIISVLKAL